MSEGKRYLEEWLDSHPNEGTQKVRLAGAKKFLAFTYGIELDSSREEYERLATSLVNEVKSGERDAFKTLLSFVVSMKDSPPTSVRSYSSSAKTFLEFSLDLEFSKKDLKGLKNAKPKGKRARTEEGELTPEVMKGIIAHSDIKGKALFLLLESSGIRIGEALRLTFEDIDLNSKPPTVMVRGVSAKEGDNYFSFMSVEALEALREWMKVRDDYIVTATKRGTGLFQSKNKRGQKDAADDRVFPFSDSVAQMMFTNAIKKLGLQKADRQTGRQAFRIHMLRKYFMSQMKLKIPVEIVEALCGHSAYLSEAYRRYSKKQIAEFYLQGESILYVNVPSELTEIKSLFQTQADESSKMIADVYQKLTDANLEVNKIRGRLEDAEIDKKKLEARLNAIDERLKHAVILDELTAIDATGKNIPLDEAQRKTLMRMFVNSLLEKMGTPEGRKDLQVKE